MTDTLTRTPPVEQPARYGGWHQVSSPGIGRLGLAGTIGGIAGLVAAFILGTLATPVAGLVLAGVTAAAVAPLLVTARDGRNGYAAASARVGFRWATARGRTSYTPALLGGRAGLGWSGPCPAPGLLARTWLRGVIVPLWGEVGVLRTRANRWSVLLDCPVDGSALIDPAALDAWTTGWGQWLATLPHESQVVAATVTVESYPDSGATLAAETTRLTTATAPALAAEVLAEVAATWPGHSLGTRAWITVTFSTHRPGHRPATGTQMTDMLIERLPGMCAALAGTGAGRVTPMTPEQVIAVIRTAYDPSAGPILDQAAAAGVPHGLDFTEAGPVAQVAAWDHLRHDDAASVTFRMTAAPVGDVTARVLAPLLDPHPGLTRKRVTLIYRHHSAAQAARIADADLRTASARAGERRGEVRAEHRLALTQARAAADEQAAGAGLTRLAVLVTATVPAVADLPAARAVLEQLAAAARLRVRPAYHTQDTAFQVALGVGVLPTDVSRVPDVLREAL